MSNDTNRQGRGRPAKDIAGDGSCTDGQCGRTAKVRGLCGRHYEQKRRTGQELPPKIKRPRTLSTPARESEISRAWREHDHAAVMTMLLSNSSEDGNGCLIWQGRLDRHGYGIVQTMRDGEKRSTQFAHRLMLQAREGSELAGLHTHHKCNTRACIRPDHLQPVTIQQNNGEMHARHSYEQRIAILEAELRRVDPTNPLVRRLVAVKSA